MTTVRHIISEKGSSVWSLPASASVNEALALMAEKGIGAIVVTSQEKIMGIFSERDYVRLVAETETLSTDVPIQQVMSHPVYFVGPEQTLEECMSVMTAKHFRHLPVMENERLVGLISIGDVVKSLIEDKETTIKGLESYILGRGFTQ